jgi:2,3-diaminopropionate biosynthesis protein SbnB
MKSDFFLIAQKTIQEILFKNLSVTYDIVKKAYLAHEKKLTVLPASHFLRFSENSDARIIALPGYLAEEPEVAGIKWISSNPKNLLEGLPRASAVIVLNDPQTARPYACLEGTLISAARTAASAVLAAEYMHDNKNISSLGIIGNGPISKEIFEYFIGKDWSINNVILFDLQPSHSISFKNQFKGRKNIPPISITNSVEELIRSCDVIVLATTTTSPYLNEIELFKHCPLILNVSLRDLSPNVVLSSNNVVDDIEHVLNANTSVHLAQKESFGNINFINGTLAKLIMNEYRLPKNKTNIFSPMGLGILDLALAKYVFDNAYSAGKQITAYNFLGEYK